MMYDYRALSVPLKQKHLKNKNEISFRLDQKLLKKFYFSNEKIFCKACVKTVSVRLKKLILKLLLKYYFKSLVLLVGLICVYFTNFKFLGKSKTKNERWFLGL